MEDKTKFIIKLKAENKLLKQQLAEIGKSWGEIQRLRKGAKHIAELKAENERLKEEWRLDCLKCEYKNTKADVDKYKQTLQEIKAIVEMDICSNCITQKRECNCQCLADTILQSITKAEEE